MTRAARRAVVTGGAGFLGSHMCERLLALGYSVVCVDNLSTGTLDNIRALSQDPNFEFREADVSAGLDITGSVTDVLHMACPASPRDYLRLPLETLRVGSAGTQHALDLAAAHGARFLLTSTSEVYGDPLVHPQPESYWGNVNPVGPRAVYDEAKRFSETLTVTYQERQGLDARIARIFNTFGPRMRGDDGRMIPTFITQALAGDPLTVAGSGEQTRSLCYVDDTVDGLLALLTSPDVHGPVNIGGSAELSVLQTAHAVITAAGSSSDVVFVPRPEDDPSLRCPDTSLAAERLGWRPRIDLEEGLRRTIHWFAESRVASPGLSR
ncbi:UDP-glucuronic acid decarboxylase family protein [Streptomyces sp. NPDC102270]|uniref:UDP-glucuronic acid decarboxylase family protein n=1 Tax=Streptomyces sp. NPDC102270 TaxID=3366150 RepID=UPI003808D291